MPWIFQLLFIIPTLFMIYLFIYYLWFLQSAQSKLYFKTTEIRRKCIYSSWLTAEKQGSGTTGKLVQTHHLQCCESLWTINLIIWNAYCALNRRKRDFSYLFSHGIETKWPHWFVKLIVITVISSTLCLIYQRHPQITSLKTPRTSPLT